MAIVLGNEQLLPQTKAPPMVAVELSECDPQQEAVRRDAGVVGGGGADVGGAWGQLRGTFATGVKSGSRFGPRSGSGLRVGFGSGVVSVRGASGARSGSRQPRVPGTVSGGGVSGGGGGSGGGCGGGGGGGGGGGVATSPSGEGGGATAGQARDKDEKDRHLQTLAVVLPRQAQASFAKCNESEEVLESAEQLRRDLKALGFDKCRVVEHPLCFSSTDIGNWGGNHCGLSKKQQTRAEAAEAGALELLATTGAISDNSDNDDGDDVDKSSKGGQQATGMAAAVTPVAPADDALCETETALAETRHDREETNAARMALQERELEAVNRATEDAAVTATTAAVATAATNADEGERGGEGLARPPRGSKHAELIAEQEAHARRGAEQRSVAKQRMAELNQELARATHALRAAEKRAREADTAQTAAAEEAVAERAAMHRAIELAEDQSAAATATVAAAEAAAAATRVAAEEAATTARAELDAAREALRAARQEVEEGRKAEVVALDDAENLRATLLDGERKAAAWEGAAVGARAEASELRRELQTTRQCLAGAEEALATKKMEAENAEFSLEDVRRELDDTARAAEEAARERRAKTALEESEAISAVIVAAETAKVKDAEVRACEAERAAAVAFCKLSRLSARFEGEAATLRRQVNAADLTIANMEAARLEAGGEICALRSEIKALVDRPVDDAWKAVKARAEQEQALQRLRRELVAEGQSAVNEAVEAEREEGRRQAARWERDAEELKARILKADEDRVQALRAATDAKERAAAALSEAREEALLAASDTNSLRAEIKTLQTRSMEQTAELSSAVEVARSQGLRATKAAEERADRELEGLREAARVAEAGKEKALNVLLNYSLCRAWTMLLNPSLRLP